MAVKKRKTHTSSAVKQRYNEKAYDRLAITIPKGHKTTIQEAASKTGESINRYVNKAVLSRLKLKEWPLLEDQSTD